LNLDFPVSSEFLAQLNVFAWDGASFRGDWDNERNQVSSDTRCRGHRHDQSVGSILAYKLGMKQLVGKKTYFDYWSENMADSVVMSAQGMPASAELNVWLSNQK
jgi:hypothetical protein